MAMNVAMMQPAFLPWQGLFELILKSDRFIFLDDFQFSLQSYHQRNRLFVNRGQVDWYSIPVQKSISFKAPLNQTRINEKIPWRKKMWKRIQSNYSKAPYYAEIAPSVEAWLLTTTESLAEQNITFINLVCELMGIKPEFRFSSESPSESRRSKQVLGLLEWCGADRYYCSRGSFGYMLEDRIFPVNHIEVLFQNFKPKFYEQIGALSGFIPSLSILDALMNVGLGATIELVRSGTEKWFTWEEMAVSGASNSTEGV